MAIWLNSSWKCKQDLAYVVYKQEGWSKRTSEQFNFEDWYKTIDTLYIIFLFYPLTCRTGRDFENVCALTWPEFDKFLKSLVAHWAFHLVACNYRTTWLSNQLICHFNSCSSISLMIAKIAFVSFSHSIT